MADPPQRGPKVCNTFLTGLWCLLWEAHSQAESAPGMPQRSVAAEGIRCSRSSSLWSCSRNTPKNPTAVSPSITSQARDVHRTACRTPEPPTAVGGTSARGSVVEGVESSTSRLRTSRNTASGVTGTMAELISGDPDASSSSCRQRSSPPPAQNRPQALLFRCSTTHRSGLASLRVSCQALATDQL